MIYSKGTDAGFYRLVPKIVIIADNENEVSRLLQISAKYKVPVTFRAAGTSLSGQSVSDSVLIVAGKNWDDFFISADGTRIVLQPKLCCGTIWESKGMPDIAEKKVRELEKALWKASDGGCYPVVCDQSPCLHRMKQHITGVNLYESAEFVWKFLNDRLEFTQSVDPIPLHLTCSTKLMKIDGYVRDLAAGLCGR